MLFVQVIVFVVDVVNIASEIEALSASLINTITLIPGAYDCPNTVSV